MITTFAFENLPLMRVGDGFEGGRVDGIATIDFSRDAPGSWRVATLRVRVSKGTTRLDVVPPAGLRALIETTLLTHPVWKGRVLSTIADNMDVAERSFERDPHFNRAWIKQHH